MAFEEDYEEAASILKRLSIQKNFPSTAHIHSSWLAQLDAWRPHLAHYKKKEHELRLNLQKRHGISDERMEEYHVAMGKFEETNLQIRMKDADGLHFKPFFGISASA